jgi:hypothetical protein
MEERKPLYKLTEAADLLAMIEELYAPQTMTKASAITLSGVRITLRTIREMILSSHDALVQDLMSKSREVSMARNAPAAAAPQANTAPASSAVTEASPEARAMLARLEAAQQSAAASQPMVVNGERSSSPMVRKDLRSSIEKFIEK